MIGFSQLPLATQSQILLAFQTMDRIIKPTRTTQGAKNSASNFQARVEPLFHSIMDRLKIWIDDFMIFCRTEKGLLETLKNFFKICPNFDLKMAIKKLHFSLERVRWCGRIIDADGVEMDPKNIEGIRNMDLPLNAAERSEFVYTVCNG